MLGSRFTLLIFKFEQNSLNNLIRFLRGFFKFVLCFCWYVFISMYIINVFLVVWKTSDIPQIALSLIVHTVQTLNTVYAPCRNRKILLTWTVPHWTLLYIHTDSHCTELNNSIRGYWNTLYRNYQYTGVLIYTVKN